MWGGAVQRVHGDRFVDGVAVGEDDSLGYAGGARGVDHRQRVVRLDVVGELLERVR